MTSPKATAHQRKRNLVFYFQVHQPKRLRALRFFDIGSGKAYFDDELNKAIIQRVATACYLPANALLLKLIRKNPRIRIAFSISGVTIDQFEAYAPEVLDSFRRLANTGAVEFLTETYYHSLACLMPGNEFELQVAKHQKKILQHFGVLSKIFRNTELICSDDTARRVQKLGFAGIMVDGAERMLGQETPHQILEHRDCGIKLLMRDYRLSDEISFRFADRTPPLTASRYIEWLDAIPANEKIVNIAMDYETFGEHQKAQSGIFGFLEALFTSIAKRKDLGLMTPGEAVAKVKPSAKINVPGFVSWADQERDLSAWLGNEMQRDAFDSLLKLEQDVKRLHDKRLLRDWRCLQTSDHFYYMSTKKGSDGDVHTYFSPYPSPYEAFINYMNVLSDFDLKIKTLKSAGQFASERRNVLPAELAHAIG